MKNKSRLILWIVFLTLVIVLITLVVTTFGSKDSAVSSVQNVVDTATEPAVEGTYTAASSIKEFFQRLFSLRQIDQEYEEMQQRIIELELENQMMEELELENARLSELLGYAEDNYEYKYIAAKVIAKDPGSWFLEFTIDRGSDDGVEEDMAVVNQYGLIGRVIEVTDTTAQIITIIDSRSAAAGVVDRSRDQGIVQGSEDSESSSPLCIFEFLPNDADIIPGDEVLSSSLGGIYPKGILIGEVQEVVYESGSVAYATIEPAVDFRQIEEVLIITEETSTEELAEILAEEEAEEEAEAEAEAEETDEEDETDEEGDDG